MKLPHIFALSSPRAMKLACCSASLVRQFQRLHQVIVIKRLVRYYNLITAWILASHPGHDRCNLPLGCQGTLRKQSRPRRRARHLSHRNQVPVGVPADILYRLLMLQEQLSVLNTETNQPLILKRILSVPLYQYIYPSTISVFPLVAIDNRHFVWTAHHAVYDGWSVATLFRQLKCLYEDGSVPKSVPYNGFIEYLSKADATASDNYWRSQLSGEKPAFFPRLPTSTYQPHPVSLLQSLVEHR